MLAFSIDCNGWIPFWWYPLFLPGIWAALLRTNDVSNWKWSLPRSGTRLLMSLDSYNSLLENVHLHHSSANAAHLQRSLEQSERGEWLEPALIEPGQAGAGS